MSRAEVWYPGAIKDYQSDRPGSSMKGGPPRGVLHTSEGYNPRGGRRYYHFTIGQYTEDDPVLVHQWRPIDRSAYGLRNLRYGVQTNRQGSACVQIAFAWKASRIQDMPVEYLIEAQKLMAWVEEQTGVLHMSRFPQGLPSQMAYGYNSESRMQPNYWKSGFGGWCAHQEVPENTHWDCGVLDWNKLLGDALDVPEVPETPEGEEMIIKKGEKGYGVKLYQEGLLAWNPDALPRYGADGDFGSETEAWVINFQTAHDLDETGEISGADGALILSY